MIYSNSFNMDTPTINNDTNKEDAIFNLQEQNKKLYNKIKEMKKVNKKLQDHIEYLVNNFKTK